MVSIERIQKQLIRLDKARRRRSRIGNSKRTTGSRGIESRLVERFRKSLIAQRKRNHGLADDEVTALALSQTGSVRGEVEDPSNERGQFPNEPNVKPRIGAGMKVKSSVLSDGLVRECDLSELASFGGAGGGEDASQEKFRFLASQVVSVGGKFYVRQKRSGAWCVRKKAEAKVWLRQDSFGQGTGPEIDADDIENFFKECRYIVLDRTIYVPCVGPFLEFEGRRCLNTWFEQPMGYDEANLGSEEFLLFLRLIHENLLGLETRPGVEIIDEIMGTDRTALRFLFHWLASNYQRPGWHLPTTIWFVGSQQGVGKGLFTTAVRAILGNSNTKQVSVGELTSEWNNFIEGNQLLVADEVRRDSKQDLSDIVKRYVGNPMIALRKRNLGQYEVPNVTNWIFTTNAIRPISVEPEDRRNVCIATTEKVSAKVLAAEFYRLPRDGKRRAYEGMAALLAAIEIDDAFISEAVWTPLKGRLCDLAEKPLLMWLKSDSGENDWKVGTFIAHDQIYANFRDWGKNNEFPGRLLCRSSFEEQMAELEKRGIVSERIREREGVASSTVRPYGHVRLDPADAERSLREYVKERIARTRSRLRKRQNFTASNRQQDTHPSSRRPGLNRPGEATFNRILREWR